MGAGPVHVDPLGAGIRRARCLAVAAVALLAGCGETTLNTEELEGEIAPEVEEQTGTRDVSVSCPDDIEVEQGHEFECELSAPGGVTAKVIVTQEDDDGNVRWRVVEP